jgi:hypothetical protein
MEQSYPLPPANKQRTNQWINEYNKTGVYKLKWSDCNKFYIEQRGRSFTKRNNGHIKANLTENQISQSTRHKYINKQTILQILY